MFQGWNNVEKEQVIYVLIKLKELFSDQTKWIDWPEAEDKNGLPIDPLDENAIKFSLMGASFKIACEKYKTPLANYVDCALRSLLNDHTEDTITGKMMSFDDEFALITLALEDLTKE